MTTSKSFHSQDGKPESVASAKSSYHRTRVPQVSADPMPRGRPLHHRAEKNQNKQEKRNARAETKGPKEKGNTNLLGGRLGMAFRGAPRAHAAQAWSRNIFRFIQRGAVSGLLVAGDVGLGLPVVVAVTVLKEA